MSDRPQSSGLVPYYRKDGDIHIYMQMRSANAKRWPSTLGFFGGGAEEGETPVETVVREIREELDIDIEDPVFFKHYDRERTDADIFLLEVEETFADRVTVLEGDYGKFYPLSGMDALDLREHYVEIMNDLRAYFELDQ